MPWWYVVGGTAGAFFVLSQGLAASALGIAVFTVAVVTGQTASGLVIDRVGLATTKPRPITIARIVGAALMLVAVILVVSTQKFDDFPIWLVLMPLLAGIGMAWQQGVNGQVRVVAKSPVTATAINFIVGTTVLAIAALVHALIAGLPQQWPTNPVLYLGGAIGAVFIARRCDPRSTDRRAAARARHDLRPAAGVTAARSRGAGGGASTGLDHGRRHGAHPRRPRDRNPAAPRAPDGPGRYRLDRCFGSLSLSFLSAFDFSGMPPT